MKWSPVAESVRHLKAGLANGPAEAVQPVVGTVDGGGGAHRRDSTTCDGSTPCVPVSSHGCCFHASVDVIEAQYIYAVAAPNDLSSHHASQLRLIDCAQCQVAFEPHVATIVSPQSWQLPFVVGRAIERTPFTSASCMIRRSNEQAHVSGPPETP